MTFLNPDDVICRNEADYTKQVKSSDSIPVAKRLIPYSLNGEKMILSSWSYDNETLTSFNALNAITPRKNSEMIYVDGIINPLRNEKHFINKLRINGKNMYFDKYTNLDKYLLNWIKNNSTRKEF